MKRAKKVRALAGLKKIPDHISALVKEADELGHALLNLTLRNGHYRLSFERFPIPVFVAGTPSDWRAGKNARAQIRRIATQHP